VSALEGGRGTPTTDGEDNELPSKAWGTRSTAIDIPRGISVGNGVDGIMSEATGRWSHKEHSAFKEGLAQYGRDWKAVASMVGTRTAVQVRTHAQKHFQKVQKETAQERQQGRQHERYPEQQHQQHQQKRKLDQMQHSTQMQQCGQMELQLALGQALQQQAQSMIQLRQQQQHQLQHQLQHQHQHQLQHQLQHSPQSQGRAEGLVVNAEGLVVKTESTALAAFPASLVANASPDFSRGGPNTGGISPNLMAPHGTPTTPATDGAASVLVALATLGAAAEQSRCSARVSGRSRISKDDDCAEMDVDKRVSASSRALAPPVAASAAASSSIHFAPGINGGRWLHAEHQRFLQAMDLFPGKAWKQVADFVRTRSQTQCRTHAQKWEQKLKQGKELATIDFQPGEELGHKANEIFVQSKEEGRETERHKGEEMGKQIEMVGGSGLEDGDKAEASRNAAIEPRQTVQHTASGALDGVIHGVIVHQQDV
jgi:SHAQKYF class myb-like DNA-binding protein